MTKQALLISLKLWSNTQRFALVLLVCSMLFTFQLSVYEL